MLIIFAVPKMVKWYKEGKFPIDKLMKLMPADDFEQGLKEMHDGVTIKPYVVRTLVSNGC